MKREEAIKIARLAAAAHPEDYYTKTVGKHEFMPHEWVISAIIEAANNGGGPAPDKRSSVSEAVFGMRDTFLQLVAAYNHVGMYTLARDAQGMAITLHTFEAEHILTGIAWPIECFEDKEGKGLMGVDENLITGEDL